jgi:hypothetical protein
VKRWIHMLCGKVSSFPPGVDPNRVQMPCPKCGVALGGWAPA